MLVQNAALHLYKAPRGSQLLKRLGGAWYIPTPGDLPLPTPNRSGSKTTLRSLAARVPVSGPRIDPFPDIPVDAPRWNDRVQTVSKRSDWDYAQIITALTELCRERATTNIFCEGLVSNRNRVDGKQVGAASAVLYHRGREYKHLETVFGESVTEADTLIRSLTPALRTLTTLLVIKPEQAHIPINILIPSEYALNRMLDTTPHEEQETALQHLKNLGELITTHPNLRIRLQWLPRKIPFVGFKRAKQLAFEAI